MSESTRLSLVTHGEGALHLLSLFRPGNRGPGIALMWMNWLCHVWGEAYAFSSTEANPEPDESLVQTYGKEDGSHVRRWSECLLSTWKMAPGGGHLASKGAAGVNHGAGSTLFSSMCFYLFFQHLLKTFCFSDLTPGLGLKWPNRHSQNRPLRETVTLPEKQSRVC